ncbi:MAG: polysaccharide deacetylase family protein [Clostridia bacterium]|nr:polysaccharide deacetylase family protein [Clostridia bacterium]
MKVHFHTVKLNYKLLICFIILLLVSSCIGIYTFTNASSYEEESIKLPIIMYHSILKDTSRSGKYIVTPSTLEADLQYIANNGYTTITMTDLIAYVYENSVLPEKPIIITFDDGHYNNLGYAVPLLKKYNMKAVISIVGKYTDTFSESDEANLNYSYLRWKDIEELMNSGIIEFQNHTYNLHSESNGRMGCSKKLYESEENYRKILSNDIILLQQKFQENTGYTPNTFTYPFGSISKSSLPIIKNLGFKASLSCSTGVNNITKNPDCLYCLKRNNRPSGISTYDFFKKILK